MVTLAGSHLPNSIWVGPVEFETLPRGAIRTTSTGTSSSKTSIFTDLPSSRHPIQYTWITTSSSTSSSTAVIVTRSATPSVVTTQLYTSSSYSNETAVNLIAVGTTIVLVTLALMFYLVRRHRMAERLNLLKIAPFSFDHGDDSEIKEDEEQAVGNGAGVTLDRVLEEDHGYYLRQSRNSSLALEGSETTQSGGTIYTPSQHYTYGGQRQSNSPFSTSTRIRPSSVSVLDDPTVRGLDETGLRQPRLSLAVAEASCATDGDIQSERAPSYHSQSQTGWSLQSVPSYHSQSEARSTLPSYSEADS